MIAKSFAEIDRADLSALVTNGVAQGRTIEFRQKPPGDADSEKSGFLADVCSMANTAGGDLIYGVTAPSGFAESIEGVPLGSDEVEIQALSSLLNDGIDPPLPEVQIKTLRGFPSGSVLILRVPRSWAAPHMVKFKGASKFFGRNSAGKFQMDVGEIRAAIGLSERLADRIRDFRRERLSTVLEGTMPTPLAANPKIVLHLIPLEAFSLGRQIPGPMLKEHQSWFHPVAQDSDQLRYNLDGFLIVGDGAVKRGIQGYCQVFRTGIVESVDAGFLKADDKKIPGEAFEQELISIIHSYLQGLKRLDMAPPIFILLSLLGVRGHQMAGPADRAPPRPATIDRDHLLLPEIMVEAYPDRIESHLRPLFDALWNASNWPQSPYFRGEEY